MASGVSSPASTFSSLVLYSEKLATACSRVFAGWPLKWLLSPANAGTAISREAATAVNWRTIVMVKLRGKLTHNVMRIIISCVTENHDRRQFGPQKNTCAQGETA